MRRNPIGRMLARSREAKDERIEMLASMTRGDRHSYLALEKRRRFLIFGLITSTAAGAYAIGRYQTAITNAARPITPIEEVANGLAAEAVNDTNADIIFTESSAIKEVIA